MSFLGLRKWPTPARPLPHQRPTIRLTSLPIHPPGRQADVAFRRRESADVVPGGQDAGYGCQG